MTWSLKILTNVDEIDFEKIMSIMRMYIVRQYMILQKMKSPQYRI